MTIQDFHALLNSEKEDSPTLEALRKLRTIEQPEEITKLSAVPMQAWTGWHTG